VKLGIEFLRSDKNTHSFPYSYYPAYFLILLSWENRGEGDRARILGSW